MPLPEYKRSLSPGMAQTAEAVSIAPIRQVLDDWTDRQQEREIAQSETDAMRQGATSTDIKTLFEPSTRAGRAYNKAAVQAHAPALDKDMQLSINEVTDAWQRGEYSEDVAKAQRALMQSKNSMLSNVDPDARIILGPRLDEKINDTVIALDTDRQQKVLARDKVEATEAWQMAVDDALVRSDEGDMRLEDDVLYASWLAESNVERGLWTIEEKSKAMGQFFNDVNIHSAVGEMRDKNGKLVYLNILKAKMNTPEGLTPDQADKAVSLALSEYNMTASQEKAIAEAEKKQRKIAEDTYLAGATESILSGEAMLTGNNPNEMVAAFEEQAGFKLGAANQNKIWDAWDDYAKNRHNRITPDSVLVSSLDLELFHGTLTVEKLNAKRNSSLKEPWTNGLDGSNYQRLLGALADQDAAEKISAEKYGKNAFTDARSVLNLAMGLSPSGFAIPGLKPEGVSAEKSASMEEYLLRARSGEDPFTVAQDVIAKYDWVKYHTAKGYKLVPHEEIIFKGVNDWDQRPSHAEIARDYEQNLKALGDKLEKGDIGRREYNKTVIIWSDIRNMPSDIWDGTTDTGTDEEFGAGKEY